MQEILTIRPVGPDLGVGIPKFLPRDRFDSYRDACSAVGGRYDSAIREQRIAKDQLVALLQEIARRGFGVALDPALAAELDAAKRELEQQAAAARSEQEQVAARLDVVKAELAKRGLAPFPYQSGGIKAMAPRARYNNFDDMGLGKTVQALLAALVRDPAAPVVVVCPGAVKGVWAREARRWRPDFEGPPLVLSGRTSFRWAVPRQIVVTSYEILPALGDEIEGDKRRPGEHTRMLVNIPSSIKLRPGTILIADEVHRLKNPRTKMARRWAVLRDQVLAAGGTVWGLTGTPLLNRPNELRAVLEATGTLLTAFPGGRKEFDQAWTWKGMPREYVPERLRRVSILRRRTEVLPDLPTKIRRDVVVPIDQATRRLADELVAKLAENGIDLAKIQDADELVRLTMGGKVPFELISKVRAALATAKIPAALEYLREYQEADEPVIVMSAHHAPIDAVCGATKGAVRITGKQTAQEKTRAEEAFQRGESKVAACTIKAGGVGLTLTAAHQELFVDLEWTPGLNCQAEDRACRIGQTRGVIITRLCADHPLEERLYELIETKQRIIDAGVNASAVSEDHDQKIDAEQRAQELEQLAAKVEVKTVDQVKAQIRQPAGEAIMLPTILAFVLRGKAAGLQQPGLRFEHLQIKMAGKYSRHCGQLHVSDGGPFGSGQYYGRIDTDGRYWPSASATDEVRSRLEWLDTDPEIIIREAVAFGHKTGRCTFCSTELTDKRSVTVGYGPICAGKFGLPWGDVVEDTKVEVRLCEEAD